MQPIEFWTFILRCLAKAALESADFFELRLRTVIIGVVLVLLGFLLHWLVKGFAETREEAYKYIILVAANPLRLPPFPAQPLQHRNDALPGALGLRAERGLKPARSARSAPRWR